MFNYHNIIVLILLIFMSCATNSREQLELDYPNEIAGRKLYSKSDKYILYANDIKSAKELRAWLDAELASIYSKYDNIYLKRGYVIGIEQDNEQYNIKVWYDKNISRRRLIEWKTKYRGQKFVSAFGRPYCLSSKSARIPYFRESFSISYDEAIKIGLLSEEVIKPAWVCFLTTNKYFKAKQIKVLDDLKELYSNEINKMHIMEKVIFYPVKLIAHAMDIKKMSVDNELMHLQRREVLNISIIKAIISDPFKIEIEINEIQSKIDKKWKYLWFHRPLE